MYHSTGTASVGFVCESSLFVGDRFLLSNLGQLAFDEKKDVVVNALDMQVLFNPSVAAQENSVPERKGAIPVRKGLLSISEGELVHPCEFALPGTFSMAGPHMFWSSTTENAYACAWYTSNEVLFPALPSGVDKITKKMIQLFK